MANGVLLELVAILWSYEVPELQILIANQLDSLRGYWITARVLGNSRTFRSQQKNLLNC